MVSIDYLLKAYGMAKESKFEDSEEKCFASNNNNKFIHVLHNFSVSFQIMCLTKETLQF